MKIEVKNFNGDVVEELKLKAGIFDIDIKDDLLHQVYVAQSANQRKVVAHTKTRGEVRGSTKKPWKQKGTGRARTGDVKNPLWRSGGTVFGPRNNRNYSKKVNKKVARLALKMAIAGKIKDGHIIVVEKYDLPEIKTARMQKALESLSALDRVLVSLNKEEKKYSPAIRNLPFVQLTGLNNVNVVDILNNKKLFLSKKAFLSLEERFDQSGKKSGKKEAGDK